MLKRLSGDSSSQCPAPPSFSAHTYYSNKMTFTQNASLKGWDMDEEAVPPGRGDAKFSWEVIRDNSIFTYRIDLVPAYAEIMAALKASYSMHRASSTALDGIL